MTISVAWVRQLRDCQELVFTSDSRVSDGTFFDSCPKIIVLRKDCAASFAGYTGHAFPMMLQLSNWVKAYPPAQRGDMEISTLRKHTMKVFDSMAQSITRDTPTVSLQPEACFLLGGYSWIKKRFELWSLSFDLAHRRFIGHPADIAFFSNRTNRIEIKGKKPPRGGGPGAKIAFIGDEEVRNIFRTRLLQKMRKKYLSEESYHGMDMEPFEVIRDILRADMGLRTIGGPPQIVKVYQFMESAPLGVFWKDRSSQEIYLQGRKCLGYERMDRWILDPDSLFSENRSLFNASDQTH